MNKKQNSYPRALSVIAPKNDQRHQQHERHRRHRAHRDLFGGVGAVDPHEQLMRKFAEAKENLKQKYGNSYRSPFSTPEEWYRDRMAFHGAFGSTWPVRDAIHDSLLQSQTPVLDLRGRTKVIRMANLQRLSEANRGA